MNPYRTIVLLLAGNILNRFYASHARGNEVVQVVGGEYGTHRNLLSLIHTTRS
jgi:hypothetical protein